MALKSVQQQAIRLNELFPEIGSYDEKATRIPVPFGKEGLFVFPVWQRMAPSYAEAVQIVLAKLDEAHRGQFRNWRADNEITYAHLRETERKSSALSAIAKQQSGYGLLVVPAQFGSELHGISIRHARTVVRGLEFFLGAFEIGIMFLTHGAVSNLDCAGDDFHAKRQPGFRSRMPIFRLCDGVLCFGAGFVGRSAYRPNRFSCIPGIPSASIPARI